MIEIRDLTKKYGELFAIHKIELNLEQAALDEFFVGLRAVETLAKTTEEMLDDMAFLAKAIKANQREIKKLTASVTSLLQQRQENRDGYDAGGEG